MLNLLKVRFKLLKDKKALVLIMVIMSIILTLVFTGSMGQTYKPTVFIIDNDQTDLSKSFIEFIKGNNTINYTVDHLENATDNIEKGRSVGGFIISKDFSKNISSSDTVNIDLIKTKDSIEMYQVSNDIQSTYTRFSMILDASDTLNEMAIKANHNFNNDNLEEEILLLGEYYYKYRNPINVSSTIIEAAQNFNYLPNLHYILGFAFFFSSFTVVFLVSDILKEKQEKIWQRKLTTPIKPIYNLLSHLITAFIVGLLQIIIVFSIGKILTGSDWGISTGLLLISFGSFIFSFTSFGLVLSGIVKTYEQLGTLSPIILVASGMLGGVMWPLEIVQNKAIQFIANFMPHKWAMQSIQRTITTGFSISSYIIPIIILNSLGIAFLLLGLALNKREVTT
ncbi:MAG: ABC transporter permease [Clostridia bacterium]